MTYGNGCWVGWRHTASADQRAIEFRQLAHLGQYRLGSIPQCVEALQIDAPTPRIHGTSAGTFVTMPQRVETRYANGGNAKAQGQTACRGHGNPDASKVARPNPDADTGEILRGQPRI
jgi:hypothetical protein